MPQHAWKRHVAQLTQVILSALDMPERQDDYDCFTEPYPEYAKER